MTSDKYEKVKAQVNQLDHAGMTGLLFYLMGYFSSNQEFVAEMDYWLNDPKFGWVTRASRTIEESK